MVTGAFPNREVDCLMCSMKSLNTRNMNNINSVAESNSPKREKPRQVKPVQGKPILEKPVQLNIDIMTKEIIKEKKEKNYARVRSAALIMLIIIF